MLEGLRQFLFNPTGLTPLGSCLLWSHWLVSLHAASDMALGLAYFAMPVSLLAMVRQRGDVAFRPVFGLFAALILLCGTGYWLNLLTLWVPAFGIEGVVKALTAVAALASATALWMLLPEALRLPSPAQLRCVSAALVESERSELGLIETARDAAAERAAADRANQAKSRFLAAISHEMRTPLNFVLGYAQLLEIDGGLNPVQAERVQAMLGAGYHLLDMIGHVLTISEIEASSVDKRLSALRLEDIAANCLAQVRPAAEAKGLAMRLVAGNDAPRRVMIDAPRLRQILLNLLGNAVRCTMSGWIELRLLGAGPGGLRIEVADTGPGVAIGRRHLLFSDMGPLDADGRVNQEGAESTGPCLAVTGRLVELMGGRIGYAPNPGGGSLFWLEIPDVVLTADALASDIMAPDLFGQDDPALQDGAQAPASRTQDGSAMPQLRILVVDDVAMNLDIAEGFLTAAGHYVVCADGGIEAVRLASSEDFDLMLMDLNMPGVDGLESTRRIRALPGARGRIPIVALTAHAFAEQVEECRTVGMDWHLAKPFTQSTLLDVIARANAVGRGPPRARAAAEPDLPIFNARTFEHVGIFLDAEKLAKHKHTLAARCSAMRTRLTEPDPLSHGTAELISSAHALAGSALMLGYDRAGHTARLFEDTMRDHPAEAAPLAPLLIQVLDETIIAMLQP